eukprot:TRINITY_DN33720_c0_g1_i1.p1 TRINITY_DN33720_c0_g1~~TRINITY_DN33720_c0_g1_i1.p1  ORF type:complete len:483 (+),score=137.17 TRINITY_DN33720_c0_g1_i1:52-1449(+)
MEDYETQEYLQKVDFGGLYRVKRRSDGELLALKVMQFATEKESNLCVEDVRGIVVNSNLVPCLDHFVEKDYQHHIIMPLYKEDLQARIDSRGVLPREAVIRMLRDVATGLACLHKHHKIHRDVKPRNIMLEGDDGSEKFLLGDHRLAKDIGNSLADRQRTGTYDCKVDMWALGVTACCALLSPEETTIMFTFLPVDHDKAMHTIAPILEDKIGPRLASIVLQLLIKEPHKRPNAVRLLHSLDSPYTSGPLQSAEFHLNEEQFLLREQNRRLKEAYTALEAESLRLQEEHAQLPAVIKPTIKAKLVPIQSQGASTINGERRHGKKHKVMRPSDPVVDSRGENDGTPLHYAVKGGQTAIVELLLDNKADPNLKDRNGDAPLHLAAEGNYADITELLLRDIRIDVNAKNPFGVTPLHQSAQNGCESNAKILLRHKADPRCRDAAGRTPVDAATTSGHHKLARLLSAIP